MVLSLVALWTDVTARGGWSRERKKAQRLSYKSQGGVQALERLQPLVSWLDNCSSTIASFLRATRVGQANADEAFGQPLALRPPVVSHVEPRAERRHQEQNDAFAYRGHRHSPARNVPLQDGLPGGGCASAHLRIRLTSAVPCAGKLLGL